MARGATTAAALVAEEEKPEPISAAYRRALKALEREGRLTPEGVVSAARNPRSPLHEYFEWDNDKAAHTWRIEQARTLIRSVKVVVTTHNREISTVYYVRDPAVPTAEQGYVSIAQLRTEPQSAKAAVQVEFARAEACLRRAHDVADALGLQKDVAGVVKHVVRVRKKVEKHAA